MTGTASLQKLLTWLSPAFPVGAFAWSAGLETAIAQRQIEDAWQTRSWIDGMLQHGGIGTDAIVLAEAYRAFDNPQHLQEIADLCIALTPASERLSETLTTGDAFVRTAAAWPTSVPAHLPQPCPYPIAVGAIAAAHGIDLLSTITAFLTAIVHGQVSVAVRLIPIGQGDGLRIMAALEPAIAARANAAQHERLEHIGSIAYAADIAQMRHETLPTRIFRS